MNENPRYSIIVLTYKRRDLINARIAELVRLYKHRSDVEVLICDNGSDNPNLRASLAAHMLKYYTQETGWSFRTMRIPENVGFGPGFNRAVAESKGELVILLSDDVRVYGDILKIIEAFIQAAPMAIIGKRVINFNSGWNSFGDHPPIQYVEGFLLAMARSIWETLGGFDERFAPCDYEDIDLGMKATQRNIPLVEANLPVEHLIAGTIGYSDERFAQTVKMRGLFAEKWGLANEPEVP